MRVLAGLAFGLAAAAAAHAQGAPSPFAPRRLQMDRHSAEAAAPEWRPASGGRAVRPKPPATRRLVKLSPKRTALLQYQLKIRDQQNRIARSLQGKWASYRLAPRPSAYAQSPGRTSSLAAEASARSPLAAHNAKREYSLAREPDGVWFVNGQQRGFVVTPGGEVVIFGKGFGQPRGQVYAGGLVGFPGHSIELQVNFWNNFEIDATVPTGVRGVPDLEGVTIAIIPPGRKALDIGGGKFVATREEIVLPATTDLHRIFDFVASGNYPAVMAARDCRDGVPWLNRGGICRINAGENLTCFQPGIDQFYVKQLPEAFRISGFSLNVEAPTDTGDDDGSGGAGNRMFIPGYEVAGWGEQMALAPDQPVETISIRWGVWRRHHSSPSDDYCLSQYLINRISVVGPAGLSPF